MGLIPPKNSKTATVRRISAAAQGDAGPDAGGAPLFYCAFFRPFPAGRGPGSKRRINTFMAEKLKKYRHGLLLLYFPFYLAAFAYLEKKVPDKVHIINCAIDQYIPFVEVFIIPYLLWFAYVAVAGIYFFFKEKESFCKWMYFGMIGMTIFIIVSYLYPNGLELRPETFTRDNIFVQLTKMIYSMDTPTNVLPSIHVFNSMAVYFAVKNSPKLKNNKAARTGAFVMTSLIILSTMFLKQHSVVDVLTALILSCLSYDFIYNERTEKIRDGLEELKFRRKRKEFSKY